MIDLRCRWCGRRVHGWWGWFHNPDNCKTLRKRYTFDEVLDMFGYTRDDLDSYHEEDR